MSVEASPCETSNTGKGDPGERSGDSGTPAPQPPPLTAFDIRFPTHNTKTLDYEATTPLHLPRLLSLMIFFDLLLLLLHTYLTPSSFN